jgi:glycolate oxidase iron-sulfur subunit
VGLFTGCTGELFDTKTIEASIRLLGRLGFDVWIPPEQSCCGALDLHAGDTKKAGMLAAANVRAFDRPELDWIATLATGCGAMLKEYPAYFPQTEQLASITVDICQLTREVIEDRQMAFQPLNKTILLHAPCSLSNVLKTADAQKALVSSIPGARIETLDQVRCCGAAGSYMIEHPEMASALRDNILKIARATRPEYLLTPNIGCALHIKEGLKQIDMAIEVIHPIVLLERQLTSGKGDLTAPEVR